MQYVYVLKEKTGSKIYIGYTKDLEQRLTQHRIDKKDFDLVYYEAYLTEEQARTRERKLKMYGSAFRSLKQRLNLARPTAA